MVNWISSEDEKNVRKVDYANLCRVMRFVKQQQPMDEMVRYVCDIFDEYVEVLSENPTLLRDSLQSCYSESFVVDGELDKSDIIISPSDLNAYFTIKQLNKGKKDLAIVCFDLHSDTYDYNDFLWKGNSFSRLMKEGYINHYIVIGVPKGKRAMCLDDTNEDLRSRVHLIDEDELLTTLARTGCKNAFVSIDADCFDCRRAKYTGVEYSPSTILNHISHIESINEEDYVAKIHACVHVRNALGYSNYYHTGENDLTVDDVIRIIGNVSAFCDSYGINLGINPNSPYFQIMEVSGYDYAGLTADMVVKLIDGLSLKEVKKNGKSRILGKNSKNV